METTQTKTRSWKWMKFEQVEWNPIQKLAHENFIRHKLEQTETSQSVIEEVLENEKKGSTWISVSPGHPEYQVKIYEDGMTLHDWPDMFHLSIKRVDKKPIKDWRDVQAIKNALGGPENEGVELFPAEDRLVDNANQYHLFVLKDNFQRFPFGFFEGRQTSEAGEINIFTGNQINQRPFRKEEKVSQ